MGTGEDTLRTPEEETEVEGGEEEELGADEEW